MDVKELKANQKYAKVVENLKKTEQKLFELREKKRKRKSNIIQENIQSRNLLQYLFILLICRTKESDI